MVQLARAFAAVISCGAGVVPPANALMPVTLKSFGSHGSPSSGIPAHIVQLFDAPRSLADAVSHFLIEGRARGNHLLVLARASHWQLIRAYLERRGFPVADPDERLAVVDARKFR